MRAKIKKWILREISSFEMPELIIAAAIIAFFAVFSGPIAYWVLTVFLCLIALKAYALVEKKRRKEKMVDDSGKM